MFEENVCKICGKPVTKYNDFCSLECGLEFVRLRKNWLTGATEEEKRTRFKKVYNCPGGCKNFEECFKTDMCALDKEYEAVEAELKSGWKCMSSSIECSTNGIEQSCTYRNNNGFGLLCWCTNGQLARDKIRLGVWKDGEKYRNEKSRDEMNYILKEALNNPMCKWDIEKNKGDK